MTFYMFRNQEIIVVRESKFYFSSPTFQLILFALINIEVRYVCFLKISLVTQLAEEINLVALRSDPSILTNYEAAQ